MKPEGVLAFSSWVHAAQNPLLDPIVEVLGPPPDRGFAPDQWGDPDTVFDRLAPGFDDIDIQTGTHAWEFDSMMAALFFLTGQSPMHVSVFAQTPEPQRRELAAAFEDALEPHLTASGAVRFEVPYAVISATRRA